MRHIARSFAAATLLASTLLPAARPTLAAEPEIAISGPPRAAIARFTGGHWTKAADTLRCAPPGAADRVVASGGATVTAVSRLTPKAPEWKALEPSILEIFETRQREHRLSAANLERVPVSVDAVYTSDSGVFYFEASRRVPDPGTAPEEDPKGTLRLTVSGWLSRSAAGIAPIGSKSQIGWDEDRPDGSAVRRPDLAPLAVVTHVSRSLWVMQGGVGDIRWISLYAVGDRGVRTVIDQVRCAR